MAVGREQDGTTIKKGKKKGGGRDIALVLVHGDRIFLVQKYMRPRQRMPINVAQTLRLASLCKMQVIYRGKICF